MRNNLCRLQSWLKIKYNIFDEQNMKGAKIKQNKERQDIREAKIWFEAARQITKK